MVGGTAPTLPALTGARWLAAFAVFLHHAGLAAYFSGQPQELLRTTTGAGHVGVSFFFVLSGFVLLWSTRPGESPLVFWWRRVARVVPLHLLTAGAALAFGLTVARSLGPRAETGGWPATLANAGLLSSWVPGWSQAGNPVSWSLVCEAFFYALFPLAALAIGRRHRRGAWGWLGLAMGGAVLTAVALDLAPWDLGRVPLLRLPEFVAGLAAARLVQLGAWPRVRTRGPVVLLVCGWVLASIVPAPYAVALATLPGFVAVIACLGQGQAAGLTRSALARTLSRPWMVRLGEWSFAFYLVHGLVMRVTEHTLVSHPGLPPGPALVLLLTILLVSVGLAGALHHGVERPANAWIPARTQPGRRIDPGLAQLGR